MFEQFIFRGRIGALQVAAVIDGVFYPSIEIQKVFARDGAYNEMFGFNVDISGDGSVMVVSGLGSNEYGSYAGAAYIFERSVYGWLEQAKIFPATVGNNQGFGEAVQINYDGTMVAISAFGDNALHIYRKSPIDGVWRWHQDVTGFNSTGTDDYGQEVAFSEDGLVMAVGAPRDDDKGSNSGSVFTYTWDAATEQWVDRGKTLAPDGTSSDNYGYTVKLSGDGNTMVVGAYAGDGTVTGSGSAYIHTYDPVNEVWDIGIELMSSSGLAGDRFGWSVRINGTGDVVAIGSPYDDDNGSSSGTVFIFRKVNDVWTEETKLYPSVAASGDRFGWSIDMSSSGNTIVVGAYYADVQAPDAGAGFVFTYEGGVWTEKSILVGADIQTNDFPEMGYSVALSGDGKIGAVCAYLSPTLGSDAGAVYMFINEDPGFIPLPPYTGPVYPTTYEDTLLASNAVTSDQLGSSTVVSEDGLIVVGGAPGRDVPLSNTGAAYVYERDLVNGGYTEIQLLTASNPTSGDNFGYSMDITPNGDRLVIGASSKRSATLSGVGAIYVFDRSGGVYSETAFLQDDEASDWAGHGYDVAISNDGKVIVTGGNWDKTNLPLATDRSGSATVWSNRDGLGWVKEQRIIPFDPEDGGYFGYSVDISGDGNFILVGSPNDTDAVMVQGSAYLYQWNGTEYALVGKVIAADAYMSNEYFGQSVSINYDGSLFVCGTPYNNGQALNRGTAYVYNQVGGVITQEAKLLPFDVEPYDTFGWDVSMDSVGTTIVVGAYTNSEMGDAIGAAYSFTRDNGEWLQRQKLKPIAPITSSSYMGYSVSVSPDGGWAACGAYRSDQVVTDCGSVFVYGSGA